MTTHFLRRVLAGALLACVCSLPTIPARASAASPLTATVVGATTTWRLTLLHAQSFRRIPHTTTSLYKGNQFRFVVLTLRMTNTGKHATAPGEGQQTDDLALLLKVRPGYPTNYPLGWAPVFPDQFSAFLTAVAHEFGGTVPWKATAVGKTTTYVFVFGMIPGEAHYGLYGGAPSKGENYLLDIGL